MPTQVNEKWILTVKELHLGHCKETFRAGAVIELDEPNGRLIIDGRRFNDTRDLDVLKRQAERYPDNPWVVPYSKEMRDEVYATFSPKEYSFVRSCETIQSHPRMMSTPPSSSRGDTEIASRRVSPSVM